MLQTAPSTRERCGYDETFGMLRPVNGLGWCYRKTNRISHDLVFTKRIPGVLSRFIARVRCPGDAGSPRSSGVPPRRSERRPTEYLFRRNLASRRRGRGIIVAVAFDSRRIRPQIEALERRTLPETYFSCRAVLCPLFLLFQRRPRRLSRVLSGTRSPIFSALSVFSPGYTSL